MALVPNYYTHIFSQASNGIFTREHVHDRESINVTAAWQDEGTHHYCNDLLWCVSESRLITSKGQPELVLHYYLIKTVY